MKCAFLGPVKTEKMGHFLRPPLYQLNIKICGFFSLGSFGCFLTPVCSHSAFNIFNGSNKYVVKCTNHNTRARYILKDKVKTFVVKKS